VAHRGLHFGFRRPKIKIIFVEIEAFNHLPWCFRFDRGDFCITQIFISWRCYPKASGLMQSIHQQFYYRSSKSPFSYLHIYRPKTPVFNWANNNPSSLI
jgi:hypothetical protein